MIKKIIYSLMLSIGLVASSYAVPLWVDTPNNAVNISGTMVSEQIHSDYAQLAIEPDMIQLVSNSVTSWKTTITTSVYRDLVAIDNGIVIALDDSKNFQISYDNGLTFTPKSPPAGVDYIGDPAMVSDAEGNIYFGCDSNGVALVFSSSDFGSTWNQKFESTNHGTRYGPSLSCSERGDVVILAGMTNDVVTNLYIVVSHDKGDSWSYIYNTWSTEPYNQQPNAQYITYAGNGIFVGCGSYLASNKFSEIFRSTDYGSTWTCSITNIDSAANDIGWIRAGKNGRVVYQSRLDKTIHVSKDYGKTWPIYAAKDNWASCIPLHLFGSHWLYTKGGYLIYTPNDFVSDYNLVQLGTAALGNDYSLKQNRDAIYFAEKFSDTSHYALFSLRKNSTANKIPMIVPIIYGSPAAFPGSVYSDGTNFYRSTNGTTWAIF